MQYTMKSGVLYREPNHNTAAKIKSPGIGAVKKIGAGDSDWQMKTDIRYLSDKRNGDVRNKTYVLEDCGGKVVAAAFPDYAAGENPDETGWPAFRPPRVDHARVEMEGAPYCLTMRSNQAYALSDDRGEEVLRVTHNGLAGGWTIEDMRSFAPAVLCGLFVFCRFIEQENEFLIV